MRKGRPPIHLYSAKTGSAAEGGNMQYLVLNAVNYSAKIFKISTLKCHILKHSVATL